MQSFGNLLRQARHHRKMRLQDLAEQIRHPNGMAPISIPYLSDLEHDRRVPSEPVLAQLAEALQLPIDLLYFALGKIPPDIRACKASEQQVLDALQKLRQTLVSSS